ncbi:DMT family transporter [Methylobacterium oryzihabitans]|uniref:DMT family transporter n=1 Tax=Methylobacterium oryzihabitans TaxID=2499852 RepID=A0A437NWD5_9HYPH|nr:DMT family transporter [Methylobacterium oryzihabitans]RVU14265.1 DMT family transporter [Methylobacterium oryzihabitans]
MDPAPSRLRAFALLALVVGAWGCNWPVTKLLVETVPPLWVTASRCWIAFAAVLAMLAASGALIRPPAGDWPALLGTALLHMVGFSTLSAAGLAVLPASQAIVLGYTTPLWVALAAPLVLGEAMRPGHRLGVGLGLVGLAVLLNPVAVDWSRPDTAGGIGLVLAASLCWTGNILLIRSRAWTARPFQLLVWQLLLAACVLTGLAVAVEGAPRFAWTGRTGLLLAFSGLVGTALGYWAMSVVNRGLPALATALGLTATPVVGIACAGLALGDPLTPPLVVAATLIVGGIAASSVAGRRTAPRPPPAIRR